MSSQSNIGKWVAGVAVVLIVGTLLWYFSSTVIYILISAVLAIVFRPVVNFLSQIKVGKCVVPRWMAALVTLVIMWIVVVGFCLLVAPIVVGKVWSLSTLDFKSVVANIQQPIEHIQHYLESMGIAWQQSVSVSDMFADTVRKMVNYQTINSAFTSVVDITATTVIAFFSVSFITFFFLKEDGLFYKMVTALFPERYKDNITRALDKITALLSRYFAGLMGESIVLMTVISVVLMLFGVSVENACFIGVIMGVMNVIPYAGPLMGGVASLFVGVVSPIEGATIGYTLAVIAGTLLTVKGLDDFVLQPTLYSERVNAHPLEVFIVLLMAGSVGGIVGMLLAIPSYTVLRVFAKEFFSQYALVKKLTKDI